MGPLVITQDFAEPGGNNVFVFIVGVVFEDANANGLYDPGEGRPGVTILPDRGTYYAVTSASGGYAIRIEPETGEVTLTASGEGFPEQSRVVTIGSDNVKADFFSAAPTSESGFDRLLVTQLKATVKGPLKDSLTLTARFNHAQGFEASDRLTLEVGDQIFWEAAGLTGQGSLKSTSADGSTATVNNRTHLITIILKKQNLGGRLAAGDVRVRMAFGTFDAALTVPLDAKLSYTSRVAPSGEVFLIQSALLKDVAADKGDSFTLSGSWSAPDLPGLLDAFYSSAMPMSFRIQSGDRMIFESSPDQFSSRSSWVLSPGKSLLFTRPKGAEGKDGVQKMTISLSNRSFALVGSKAALSTSFLGSAGTSPATIVLTVGGAVYRTDILLTGNGAGRWKY